MTEGCHDFSKNPKCGNIWVTTVEKFRSRLKALVNVLLTVNGANCWDYRLDTLQTSGYEVFEVLMKTVGKFLSWNTRKGCSLLRDAVADSLKCGFKRVFWFWYLRNKGFMFAGFQGLLFLNVLG